MIYKISRWIGLAIFSMLIIIPSAMVVLGTFKTDLEIYDSPLALPIDWTLNNYRRLLDDGEILTNFKNSVLVTSLSVLITLVLASMVSFARARMSARRTRPVPSSRPSRRPGRPGTRN
jgi:raffinose/stachyose/melibiose transport system permease protein